jgi:hypothetical protein
MSKPMSKTPCDPNGDCICSSKDCFDKDGKCIDPELIELGCVSRVIDQQSKSVTFIIDNKKQADRLNRLLGGFSIGFGKPEI